MKQTNCKMTFQKNKGVKMINRIILYTLSSSLMISTAMASEQALKNALNRGANLMVGLSASCAVLGLSAIGVAKSSTMGLKWAEKHSTEIWSGIYISLGATLLTGALKYIFNVA